MCYNYNSGYHGIHNVIFLSISKLAVDSIYKHHGFRILILISSMCWLLCLLNSVQEGCRTSSRLQIRAQVESWLSHFTLTASLTFEEHSFPYLWKRTKINVPQKFLVIKQDYAYKAEHGADRQEALGMRVFLLLSLLGFPWRLSHL